LQPRSGSGAAQQPAEKAREYHAERAPEPARVSRGFPVKS
jgi:hypothetical protein